MHEAVANGFSSEMAFAAAFTDAGYVVSIPFIRAAYDLIVDSGNKLHRIQVKKARREGAKVKPQGRGDRAGYYVDLNTKGRKCRRRLDITKFDYLAVFCCPTMLYLIPATRLSSDGRQTFRMFRIKPPELLDNTRADSREAAERWEQYRNNFKQLED